MKIPVYIRNDGVIDQSNHLKGDKLMNYLSDYQPFSDKKELNEAVSSHFDRCHFELNETDREILLMLSRYSVKYPGVAHLKASTIAKAVKKSNRTVQRSIRKMEHLLIIEKKPFIRQVSGGFGANLYIFLPSNVISELSPRGDEAKPDRSTVEAAISENEPILFISNKDLYIHNTYEQVTVTHYTRFKNCIQSFNGEDNQPHVQSTVWHIPRTSTAPIEVRHLQRKKRAFRSSVHSGT